MTAPGEPTAPSHRPWLVLITLCLGFFMILLDTTIVQIAIPDLSNGLGASLAQILWILNAYILVYAVLLITAGRLGDLFGPKRLFILGLVIFTLASMACGSANTPGQLVFWRVVQGTGGALLAPQTLTVITMIFPPEKRGAAFGIWGSVAGIATIAGPTLGGYLVTNWGWEYIFFVNLPVGIVAVVLAAIIMPDIRLNRRHRLDWPGTALASTGLFLVVYGLIEGEPHDWGRVWGPVTIPEVIGAGVLVLVVFMWHQYANRSGEPLIPFAIFSDGNYSLMNLITTAMAFAMLGFFIPIIIYLQSVLGLTALQAGLAVAPLSVMSMFAAPIAGRFADRTGGKWVLMAGLVSWTFGMGLVVWLARVDSGQWDFLPGLLIGGAGLGMMLAPLQVIAMRNVAPQVAGAASGFINTARQLGGVMGSAAVGAVLQVQLVRQLPDAARENAGALPEPLRDRFVAGFAEASSGNLHVGAGQSGIDLPADVPEQARQVMTDAALRTFHEAFTAAMKTSVILPLSVLAVAAVACLFIRGGQSTGPAPEGPAAGGPGPDPLPEPESEPVRA